MPRTAAVQLPADVLKDRLTAYQRAYSAVQDAIDTDVDFELVDSAFLHPLSRARDYLGKEAGKMARMQKSQAKEATKNENPAPNTPVANGQEKATAGAKSA